MSEIQMPSDVLKEIRSSYLCVTPQNQSPHKSQGIEMEHYWLKIGLCMI